MSSINNVERFRQRMREGKICVGTSVQVADPLVSEVAAQAGNDVICGSMGKLGQHFDPEVLEAIDTVFARTRQTDLFIGVSIGYDPGTVKEWREKGVHFFVLSEELSHIYDGCKMVADAVHALDG